MRAFLLLFFAVLGLGAPQLAAQEAEDDRSYLQALLEDSLSDAGRQVRIVGFQGALSSTASVQEISIADAAGVWLRLRDVTLNWNRAALFSGRLEVTELSAGLIELSRWPATAGAAMPEPEASPFALPELPVSIQIGRVATDRIDLGPDILGQPVSLRLAGTARLEGGEGRIELRLDRIDGIAGRFALMAGYANSTGLAEIDLRLSEPQDGIVASLARIPGAGALDLSVTGAGPLDDFTARIALATEDVRRLDGTVTLSRATTESGDGPMDFSARLAGDIAPLFLPEYRDFFGDQIRLDISGRKQADGGLTLDEATLRARSIEATAQLDLDDKGWPRRASVLARIAGTGGPVLLPLAGAETRAGAIRLSFSYDASLGDEWSGALVAEDLRRGAARLGRLQLAGAGRIVGAGPDTLGQVSGALDLVAQQIRPADAALARAIGTELSGRIVFSQHGAGPLDLSELRLAGADYALAGAATLAPLPDQFGRRVNADVRLTSSDLGRFSGLAGRNIAGGAEAGIAGQIDLPSGAFDLRIDGTAISLRLGQPQLDRLLAGRSSVTLDARRDASGTVLRDLVLSSDQITGTASGRISSTSAEVDARLVLRDGRSLFAGLPGRIEADLRLTDPGPEAALELTGGLTSASGSAARIAGTLARDGAHLDLAIDGTAPLELANPFLSPRALEGQAAFDLRLAGPPDLSSLSGRVQATGARFVAPTLQLSLEDVAAEAQLTNGQARIDLRGALSSGGRLRVTGTGDLTRSDLPADLDLRLRNLRLSDRDLYEVDLGGELSLRGPLTGGAVISGRIELDGAELRVPESGLGVAEGLPGVTHLNEPADVRATRARAGLLEESPAASGPAYGLDVTISAPARIFVRGRGLDAELGGAITLGGTTQDVIPQGQFRLIRGRLDILGKRLTLTEGAATLRGSFDPFLNLVAETRAEDTAIRITVSGAASAPDVLFSSVPELPQEEILARLIFGRGLSSLSPLQALRLASAVGTLAGYGGTSTIDRLRQSFGLDDLDITTAEDGTTGARLGRYLGENIYSDVTIGTGGTAEINLNLKVSPSVTARGSLDTDGDSSLGLFFERDY